MVWYFTDINDSRRDNHGKFSFKPKGSNVVAGVVYTAPVTVLKPYNPPVKNAVNIPTPVQQPAPTQQLQEAGFGKAAEAVGKWAFGALVAASYKYKSFSLYL
jgi:hypothetical protein